MPSFNSVLVRGSAALAFAAAHVAGAQELHGTVTDSATRLPIAGAVVVLLDSANITLSRSISNERGQYRLGSAAAMRRLRVVRMGFRPRELRVANDASQLDVVMAYVPSLLETVRVSTAPSCPRRRDRQAALALREQARAGLLTTVVAREAKRAAMVKLNFERTLDRRNRIQTQTVRIDSSSRATGSWQAAFSASVFVRNGFLLEGNDSRTFYGPDADVLLDDAFANGYCYHIRADDRNRPRQVGLAFVPANRVRGRVDVDGTLWVDTAARKLRDIEFQYLGLDDSENSVRPGGSVSFWEMPNGVVFIDKWSLRLPNVGFDTTYNDRNLPVVRKWTTPREAGGEVASAVWPEGHAYQAPLGVLNARAVDSQGNPVAGVIVRLVDTDYLASPDERGFFEIHHLLPGPYVAVVIESSLAPLGITLPTALRFVAQRDSVVQERLAVPAPDQYVSRPCGGRGLEEQKDRWLIARVMTRGGKPATGAHWELRKDNGVDWQLVTESRLIGPDGYIHYCMKLGRGDRVEIRAWHAGETPEVERWALNKKPTEVTIELPNP